MSAVFDDLEGMPLAPAHPAPVRLRPVAERSAAPMADDSPALAADPCVTPHEFWLPGSGERGRTGVLLVHGLTGTPNEMRLLGKGLHRAGFSVLGVQLAGHCGDFDDLLASRWTDWTASVRDGARRLQAQVDRVVVMGLSMGAVLALGLAAEPRSPVAGVVALSTMFRHDGWSIPAYTRLSFLLKPFRFFGIGRRRVFLEQPPYGIKDEALRRRIVEQMNAGDSAVAGLTGNPWYSIIEMHDLADHVQARLDRVRVPCLLVHAVEDDISSVENARMVERSVQGPVQLMLLHDSYHMVTIDRERRAVTARCVDFVTSVAGLGAAAAG
jgi:carboxylesterase